VASEDKTIYYLVTAWDVDKKERALLKIKTIPKFNNYKEEAEFWDMHSFADYWEDSKDILKVKYAPKKISKEVMTLRIDPALKKSIENMAEKKSLTYSSLIRTWLVGRV